MGYRSREQRREQEDYQAIRERKKKEAQRDTLETVKSYRLIEHSIILDPSIMKMLKEIAFERGNAFTYSQTVAFLVNYYHKTQKENQWRHDHPHQLD